MVGPIVTLALWLVSLTIVMFGIFYIYVKNLFKYFEERGIPFENPKFPLGSFTATAQMKRSISGTIADIYARSRNHKFVGFFFLWRKQFLIRDPEIVKNVLIKEFDIFQERGVYYNKEKDPLSAHLFSLGGDIWKFLRAKLSPTFTSGKLKGMHSIILDCSDKLCNFIKAQSEINENIECHAMFGKFANTIVSATAFGLENDSISAKHSKFYEMVRKMNEPTLERLCAFVFTFNGHVAKMLNIRVTPELVSQFFTTLVSDAIKYRERTGTVRNDYLQQLIDLRNTSEGTITEEVLAAQAFVFIVAGSETTSSAMSFCLYELSRNPEVQARLQRELDSLPDLSYDNIQGCQYLDMVVSETLRLYPPLGFLNRECSRDYQIPGSDVVIEKGTQVVISVQGLHSDPDLYPNPQVFDPERFSKENKDDIKPYTYMPFGDGPRYCIGKRFALTVVKTGLATILRRFEVRHVEPSSSLKVEPRTVITTVAGGLRLRFIDRS